MSCPGRPRLFDDNARKTICSLVAEGASLRQAAHFVACDSRSIRREAERNVDFRRELAKARSEASLQPLQTLRQAANDNWQAALAWMKRLEPGRFGRSDASVVTKREANQFLKDLFQIIEKVVASPRERRSVYRLLTVAMPQAMRRHWQGGVRRDSMQQAMHDFAKQKDEEVDQRCRRREEFIDKFGKHLPWDLLGQLRDYSDVLDLDTIRVDREHNQARRALIAPEPSAILEGGAKSDDCATGDGATADGDGEATSAPPESDFASGDAEFCPPPAAKFSE